MRFEGKLKSWHDDRGFGFIEPTLGGQEIFVHIKSFPPGTKRPSVGQVITFEVALNSQGKKQAINSQYPVKQRKARAP
ncbi:MAG: cold shock domain-containing protein [Rugosibacter sp.]|nr:cold shock domain-containing protein [Rugosibacter sp.]